MSRTHHEPNVEVELRGLDPGGHPRMQGCDLPREVVDGLARVVARLAESAGD